jgi:hypothetical protein
VVNWDAETEVREDVWCVSSREFRRSTPDASEMQLAELPPFEDLDAVMGMEGKISQGKVVQRIDLVK